MANRRRRGGAALRGFGSGWHHATGCPALSVGGRHKTQAIYNAGEISERHRHRYEVNSNYVARLEEAGMKMMAGRWMVSWWRSSSCPLTPGLWPASSTRSSSPGPAGPSLSPASLRPRWRWRSGGDAAWWRHRAVDVAGRTFANDQPLVLIGGINVLEAELAMETAAEFVRICEQLSLPFVFKASFDKANRSSIHSFRGLALRPSSNPRRREINP